MNYTECALGPFALYMRVVGGGRERERIICRRGYMMHEGRKPREFENEQSSAPIPIARESSQIAPMYEGYEVSTGCARTPAVKRCVQSELGISLALCIVRFVFMSASFFLYPAFLLRRV